MPSSRTCTTHHNILDTLLVEINGESGRAVDQLRQMYRRYRVEDLDRTPDVRCFLSESEPQPDQVLSYPQNHYARDGHSFVVQRGPNYVVTDPGWQQFVMNRSPGWEPYRTTYMIEFELRRRLLDDRQALIHASGVQYEGQTILFPAWRCAGKTNTLFSLLLDGGNYLSDDRLWVGEDGAVQGFPTPVDIGPEQRESFPALDTVDDDWEQRVEHFIDARVTPSRSFPEKLMAYLTNQFASHDRTFRDLESLVPGAEYVDEATADAVVLLRAAPKRESVSVEELPASQVAKSLRAIHHYEWNGQLEEYAMATDSLFPSADRTDTFETVRSAEEEIQTAFLESTPTYIARLPRTQVWNTTGITTQVRETFRNLVSDTATEQPIQPGG